MAQDRASISVIVLSAYLPTLLFSAAEGTMLPVLPNVAQDLGADLAFAGFVASLVMVGKLLGDIPSGWLAARFGERNAMLGACGVSALSLLLAALAPTATVLGVAVLFMGMAEATFSVARHAFMTVAIPITYRARALSTLGGTFRAGWVVGPFLAAGIIAIFGSPDSVFWFCLVFIAAVGVVLLLVPDPDRGNRPVSARRSERSEAEAAEHRARTSVLHAARSNWGTLWRLGSCAGVLQGLRTARQVLVPLWGVSLGLDPAVIALVVGIAAAVDFALFYASGQLMDRFGRFWACVPPALGLGAGYLVLAFSGDFAAPAAWFVGISVVLALANGLSSGVLMTLGADLAPAAHPAPFLGAWRFAADVGAAGVPLVVSLLTAVASLAVASGVIGLFGFVGAVGFARWLPRYLPAAARGRGGSARPAPAV